MKKQYPIYIKMLKAMNGLTHKVGDIVGMSNIELAKNWISKGYAKQVESK